MKRRREYVELIEEKLGTEQLSTKRISAPGAQKLYEELTGNKAQPIKGRAWHIEQSIKALDREVRKTYSWNSVTTPQDHLHAFWQELQHR